MFVDITGKKRLKVGLHTHTKRSDGRKTPEEVIALYGANGYDALALTDHWVYADGFQAEGMQILSGCEYNMSGTDLVSDMIHTFHIVGFCMEQDPLIPKTMMNDPTISIFDRVRFVVEKIRSVGGVATLAHPAWSLNTAEQIIEAGDFDALEIYNSVSDWMMSDRPYSGLIVDMLAAKGVVYPITATDDTHYYDGDEMRGMTMLEADAVEELGIAGAIRAGKFYSTMGPEVHLERLSQDEVKVTCTPAVKVAFLSSVPWTKGRMIRGENITEATYTIKHHLKETYIRAEVTDAEGRVAWSNILVL